MKENAKNKFLVEKKQPIAPILKKLDRFKTVEFPLSRASVVRSTIHNLSFELEISFTTKKNNENRMLEVTRIS